MKSLLLRPLWPRQPRPLVMNRRGRRHRWRWRNHATYTNQLYQRKTKSERRNLRDSNKRIRREHHLDQIIGWKLMRKGNTILKILRTSPKLSWKTSRDLGGGRVRWILIGCLGVPRGTKLIEPSLQKFERHIFDWSSKSNVNARS